MQCGNIASRTNGAGCIYTEYVHTIYIYKLGECGALWGEREGVVRCIIVFHSTTFSHLHTSHITIVSFL